LGLGKLNYCWTEVQVQSAARSLQVKPRGSAAGGSVTLSSLFTLFFGLSTYMNVQFKTAVDADTVHTLEAQLMVSLLFVTSA
jgi:hypothetical protein